MTTPTQELRQIPLDELHESPMNHRKHFDPIALQQLAESLRSSGQITPITVRPSKNGHGGFEIAAGHRRLRAAKEAGLTQLDALVRELDDKTFLEILTIENLQRDDLHPLEEAEGFASLMKSAGYDVAKIATRVGRSHQYVYDRLRLLQLTKPAQKLFLEDKFTVGHAVILARLSPKDQARALDTHDTNYRPALFETDDGELRGENGKDPLFGLKPRSVKDLQAWVDGQVRFDLKAQDLPDLFPETAVILKVAAQDEIKVVQITREFHVPDPAKQEGVRTVGPMSWRRADGQVEGGRKSKPSCDHTVFGVVVVGPGRGEVFAVCLEKKKCRVHWPAPPKSGVGSSRDTAGAQRSQQRQAEKWQKEQQEREVQAERWRKAGPALLEAVAAKLATIEDAGPASLLGKVVLNEMRTRDLPKPEKYFPTAGKDAVDVVRMAAFMALADTLRPWNASTAAPKALKPFGIDAPAIVEKENAGAERKCEVCGCTDAKACPGGCSWDKTQRAAGHDICSSCTVKVQKAKRAKKPAKAKRKTASKG